MKKHVVYSSLLLFAVFTLQAQDLSRSEVPSVILNNFQSTFPKAADVEWEKKGENYQVEFEVGSWKEDRQALYNQEGKLLCHVQEISRKYLPEAVYEAIKKDYKWYVITDVKRITEGQKITFQVELKSFTKEWEVGYNESGEILSRKRN